MLEMFSGFDSLVNSMITPPRQAYSIDDLGKIDRCINKQMIRRRDFKLRNRRGYLLECSHFAPVEMKTKLPCVVYMHGSGCSRLEALPYIEGVCRNEMTLFCFDFSGCGQSQGPISSIGWYEQEDVEVVIHHLYNSGKVSRIALWGRSMGAITSLLYSRRDYRISCIIVDSSFASFKQLVQEFVKKMVSLPSFMTFAAYSALRSSILKKAGFDIELLEPINHVEKMSVPALFATGDSDDFILPTHTKQLHELYKGPKELVVFDGGHNSKRPLAFVGKAIDFLKQHTAGVNDPLPENLQRDAPSLRTEPLKFAKRNSEEKAEKTEERKSIKSSMKPQGTITKKPLPQQQKTAVSPTKPLQKEPEKQVTQMIRPKFQFSWLEHSNSSPSLLVTQKESSKKAEEEKTNNNNFQIVPSEVSFENPQKDSIAIENSPLQPNQTVEISVASKRNESVEATSRRVLQPSPMVSSLNLKPTLQFNRHNLPVLSTNASDTPKRKHLPIFQNVEKRPLEPMVLKIDLSPLSNTPSTKESSAESEKTLKQETENEKGAETAKLHSERTTNALDSFRTRSYSTTLLTKNQYSSSSGQTYHSSYTSTYQKHTFNSTMTESPKKIFASESGSGNSTSISYRPPLTSKYNYSATSQQYASSYERKTPALGEIVLTKSLSVTKFNTGNVSNEIESPKIQVNNVTRGQEQSSRGTNVVGMTPNKNEYSPTNPLQNYSPSKRVNYGGYQSQQRKVENLMKPYKLSEYSERIFQAKKAQNKSVDVVLRNEVTTPRGIFNLQRPPAVIEQRI